MSDDTPLEPIAIVEYPAGPDDSIASVVERCDICDGGQHDHWRSRQDRPLRVLCAVCLEAVIEDAVRFVREQHHQS